MQVYVVTRVVDGFLGGAMKVSVCATAEAALDELERMKAEPIGIPSARIVKCDISKQELIGG